MSEYEIYVDAIDIIQHRIEDDTKYPVVEDNNIKNCCKVALEFAKFLINHYMSSKKKTNSKIKKKPIPEDYELSDEEPTKINLNEEQKLSSKFITFNCPNCFAKLQLQNEIEINPKGITCRCSPCSFKISKNDKTMNVSRDDDGGITLDSEIHSISFSFNKQITPESEDEKTRSKMVSGIMGTPRGAGGSIEPSTPRSKKQSSMSEMD